MNELTEHYIIGHLDWRTRVRFVLGLAVSCILFASLGWSVLKPWDPYGAIYFDQEDMGNFMLLVRSTGLLLAAGVFASIIMDARMPLFGVFAACIGMAIPILKTGGMDYVMVRTFVEKSLDHPEALWGFLALETLAWTGVLAVLVTVSLLTEQWLKKDQEPRLAGANEGTTAQKNEGKNIGWWKGLGGTAITAVLGIFLVAVLAANMQKGQVMFACVAGLFVASLAAEQITENDHPVWQVAAVPIVALAAYLYTWFNPVRPPGWELILHIAPNSLARVLPVEYIFIGTIGAIFGNWTSHRMRYNKHHG
jgi:hypothetical protein